MGKRKGRRQRAIAMWDALRDRYPVASRLELLRPAATTLAANFVTARLVLRGELAPWELVLLVAAEALLLSGVARLQNLGVPRADRLEERPPLGARLGALAFGLVWLAVVYGIILGTYLRETASLLVAARDPLAWFLASPIRWPLAITAAGAILDAVADRRFWRARGGPFVSTPAFGATARWLTLYFGGIPFFVPLALGVGGVAWIAKRLESVAIVRIAREGAASGPGPKVALAIVPLLAFVLLGTVGLLVRAGLFGWVFGFFSAKAASELLIVALPLIARRAGDDERRGEGPRGRRSAAAQGGREAPRHDVTHSQRKQAKNRVGSRSRVPS